MFFADGFFKLLGVSVCLTVFGISSCFQGFMFYRPNVSSFWGFATIQRHLEDSSNSIFLLMGFFKVLGLSLFDSLWNFLLGAFHEGGRKRKVLNPVKESCRSRV